MSVPARGTKRARTAVAAAIAASTNEQHSARVRRSVTQGLLLLGVDVTAGVYNVMGASGTAYNVTVDRTVRCECMDFQRRQRKCKHILFVLGRVLRLSVTQLDELGPQDTLSDAMRADLTARGAAFMAARRAMGPTAPSADAYAAALGPEACALPAGRERDNECGICTELFGPLAAVRDCRVCLHTVHVMCVREWHASAHKPANECMYCRAADGLLDSRLFTPPGARIQTMIDPPPQQQHAAHDPLPPAPASLQLTPAPRRDPKAPAPPCWLPPL